MFKQFGFTLLECLVVLAVLSVMTAIALPSVASWRETAEYRKIAREIASSLRETRSRAIRSNLEHRLEVDLENKRFRLTHGNRPTNSTETSWNNFIVFDWIALPDNIVLRGTLECDEDEGIVKFHFNPNGTGNSLYLCIIDNSGANRFRIGVPSSTTGRVIIRKWQVPTAEWE